MLKIVSIKLANEQYEILRQYVKTTNKTQSEVIRNALNEYFARHLSEITYKHLPYQTKRIKIYV